MVSQLETLAHNLLAWTRCWPVSFCPKIASFGMLRMIRDILQITGRIWIDQQ